MRSVWRNSKSHEKDTDRFAQGKSNHRQVQGKNVSPL